MQNNKKFNLSPVDFIAIGVACNCLTALYYTEFWQDLSKGHSIEKRKFLENHNLNKSILATLTNVGIFEETEYSVQLSKFGGLIAEYIGLITIFFDGYAKLVASQKDIIHGKTLSLQNIVDWASVSKASIEISKNMVDPILLEELKNLRFDGPVCDLGCGHGRMLVKIAEQLGHNGIGFESSIVTVQETQKQKHPKVEIFHGNITELSVIRKDIQVLMQAFVFHDFNPQNNCVKIINSYKKNFPSLRYFLYIDIMTPSEKHNELFPGFDYIHGLLGIPTRTYEETLDMITASDYFIQKEIKIPKLPNTFMWILERKTDERT